MSPQNQYLYPPQAEQELYKGLMTPSNPSRSLGFIPSHDLGSQMTDMSWKTWSSPDTVQ